MQHLTLKACWEILLGVEFALKLHRSVLVLGCSSFVPFLLWKKALICWDFLTLALFLSLQLTRENHVLLAGKSYKEHIFCCRALTYKSFNLAKSINSFNFSGVVIFTLSTYFPEYLYENEFIFGVKWHNNTFTFNNVNFPTLPVNHGESHYLAWSGWKPTKFTQSFQ